jgi:HPt (histidine-containing phosphotransfer) domain-containing protein
MPSEGILDNDAIEALRALGDDDDEFLSEIVEVYLTDAPGRIAEMRRTLSEGNQENLIRAAHSLKGSSANVGAIRVRAAAEKIEHAARHGELAGLGTSIDGVEPLLQEARDALTALVAQS